MSIVNYDELLTRPRRSFAELNPDTIKKAIADDVQIKNLFKSYITCIAILLHLLLLLLKISFPKSCLFKHSQKMGIRIYYVNNLILPLNKVLHKGFLVRTSCSI